VPIAHVAPGHKPAHRSFERLYHYMCAFLSDFERGWPGIARPN